MPEISRHCSFCWDENLRIENDHIPRSQYLQQVKLKIGNNGATSIQVSHDYQEAIGQFVKNNGIGGSWNPSLHINGQIMKQTKVLSKYVIIEHPFCQQLNGQHGVKAMCKIPKKTLIGKYKGIEYTPDEFNTVYDGTNCHYKARSYALSVKFDATQQWGPLEEDNGHIKLNNDSPMIDLNDPNIQWNENVDNIASNENDEKQTTIDNLNDAIKEIDYIVMDGWGMKHDLNLMLFMNDGRPNMEGDDNSPNNAELVPCLINNWPHCFIVTTKDIEPQSPILCDYGPLYGTHKKRESQQVNVPCI